MTSSHAVRGTPRVIGRLRVPGDKAISHRALLIGAGCSGTVTLAGVSTAHDVRSSLQAVLKLGKHGPSADGNSQLESFATAIESGDSLKLEGSGRWESWPSSSLVDCENSGTTMRLLMGILAGRSGEVELVGDPSLSRRPMKRVADPLGLMGAEIALGGGGNPPVRIRGGALRGIRYELPVASAQVKTAVLLAGLQAEGATTVVEPIATRDHTERLVRFLGAPVSSAGREIGVEASELFGDKEINIPGDFSSASFLLTAAAIADEGDVTVLDVGLNPTRTAFLEVLRRFGADVEAGGVTEVSGEPRGWIRVRSGDRRPPWVEPHEIPSCIDELPLVAVLAAVAEGTTELRGAEELRVKESDRVATIVDGLARMGTRARTLPDGFVVEGGPLRGTTVQSYGDHRIAMALAVAGLAATGETVIEGWDAVGVSYPEFGRDLALVTAR